MTPRPWRQAFLVGAVLAGLAIGATWPMASDPVHIAVTGPTENDFRLNTYLIFWGAHALLTDPAALHHTNMFHPERYTFVYADMLLAHSLLMLPVIEAAYEPVLTYNVLLLTSLVIGGVGFFFLARLVTGASHPVALLGAVLWAFNPVHFTRYQQIQLFGDHWMPWLALALWLWLCPDNEAPESTPPGSGPRIAASPPLRYAVAAAAFFCLNAQSGSHNAVFGALLSGAMIGYFALRRSFWRTARLRRGLFAFSVICLLVLAPLFWPYLMLEQQMAGARAATLQLDDSSLRPLEMLTAGSHFYRWLDTRWGWPSRLNHEGREVTTHAFPGLICIALAVAGWVAPLTQARRSERRFWTLSFALFVFLAMGTYGGYALFGNLPLIRLIRVPTRFATPAVLPLAMLATYGAAWLWRRVGNERARVAALACIALMFAGEASYAPLRTWTYEGEPQVVNAFLAAQPGDFAVVEFPLDPFAASINMRQVFNSIFHWKRLLVGYSGYQSIDNMEMLSSLSDRFPASDCLDDLRRLDVLFVVVLPDRVDPRLLVAIAQQPRLVKVLDRSGWLIYRVEG